MGSAHWPADLEERYRWVQTEIFGLKEPLQTDISICLIGSVVTCVHRL